MTLGNWIFNFLVVMITPVAFDSIDNHTYTIFAVINAIMVPSVYFFYPETAYRSLEEMDTIFHNVSGASAWTNVVSVARDLPRRYGKNGELLVDYQETEEHKARVGALEQPQHHEEVRSSSNSDVEKGPTTGTGGAVN